MAADEQTQDPLPRVFGLIMIIIGAGSIILGWIFAVCVLLTGRNLAHRTRYGFCLVVLGVFTILVLTRDSAKAQFIDEQTAEETQDESPAFPPPFTAWLDPRLEIRRCNSRRWQRS